MMNLYDKFDEYNEKLLLAQFEVSEMIVHQLTKGEIREDFLKDLMKKQYPRIEFVKGVITDGLNQSGQCDIIIVGNNTNIRNRAMGSHNIVDICDCKIVLEVKSKAKSEDFKKFNLTAKEIKNLNNDFKPLCGMFCYQIDFKEVNILKRFGFNYDNELDIYEFSKDLELKYPNIDFIISLHKVIDDESGDEDRRQFYVRWNPNPDPKKEGYLLFRDYPISKHLFSLLKSIN